ncbi:hypothetical protein [Streptomyces sp. NPDC059564]|uniref:HflX-like GTP-binding protein n=1 Tax=Streptomyces sp. NPDC059564 TaxID=3346865 RepID=UPI003682A782
MHPNRKRERRPQRPKTAVEAAVRTLSVAGADLVLVGLFSSKRKEFVTLMDEAEARVSALGGRVVGRIVQRRGVSDGGVRLMERPFSSRTLLRSGKVREAAALRERTAACAVVFLSELTECQRRVLSAALGCPAVSLADCRAVR